MLNKEEIFYRLSINEQVKDFTVDAALLPEVVNHYTIYKTEALRNIIVRIFQEDDVKPDTLGTTEWNRLLRTDSTLAGYIPISVQPLLHTNPDWSGTIKHAPDWSFDYSNLTPCDFRRLYRKNIITIDEIDQVTFNKHWNTQYGTMFLVAPTLFIEALEEKRYANNTWYHIALKVIDFAKRYLQQEDSQPLTATHYDAIQVLFDGGSDYCKSNFSYMAGDAYRSILKFAYDKLDYDIQYCLPMWGRLKTEDLVWAIAVVPKELHVDIVERLSKFSSGAIKRAIKRYPASAYLINLARQQKDKQLNELSDRIA